MANTKQARHRARQSTVRNAHNSAQRSRLRTAVKSVRKAIEGGDKKVALDTLNRATSVIDSIADKKSFTRTPRHATRADWQPLLSRWRSAAGVRNRFVRALAVR